MCLILFVFLCVGVYRCSLARPSLLRTHHRSERCSIKASSLDYRGALAFGLIAGVGMMEDRVDRPWRSRCVATSCSEALGGRHCIGREKGGGG